MLSSKNLIEWNAEELSVKQRNSGVNFTTKIHSFFLVSVCFFFFLLSLSHLQWALHIVGHHQKKNLLFEQIYVIISESTLIVVAPLSANEWVGMKWTFLADRSWGSYDICIHICLLAECVLCATEYIVRLMCLLDSLSFSKYKLITIYKESLVCFVFFLFWCVRSLFWKRFNNLARISSGEKKVTQ